MKIIIDKNLCLGCGTCTVIAPKTFKLGSDGKAEVIDLSGDEEKSVRIFTKLV